jgi:hypothetical protein
MGNGIHGLGGRRRNRMPVGVDLPLSPSIPEPGTLAERKCVESPGHRSLLLRWPGDHPATFL